MLTSIHVKQLPSISTIKPSEEEGRRVAQLQLCRSPVLPVQHILKIPLKTAAADKNIQQIHAKLFLLG